MISLTLPDFLGALALALSTWGAYELLIALVALVALRARRRAGG